MNLIEYREKLWLEMEGRRLDLLYGEHVCLNCLKRFFDRKARNDHYDKKHKRQ